MRANSDLKPKSNVSKKPTDKRVKSKPQAKPLNKRKAKAVTKTYINQKHLDNIGVTSQMRELQGNVKKNLKKGATNILEQLHEDKESKKYDRKRTFTDRSSGSHSNVGS